MSLKRTSKENELFLSYGIDLGTTNSCIAKQEEDEIRIFQTRENTNTTRSAVYITKTKRKIVGLRAYNALYNDPENVAVEFKRLMGTTHTKLFPAAGVTLTAEELSSEVLKSMRQDAERLTEVSVRAAVITVPAAFGALQCESTYKSAELAGIETVHLLQEPIAAAIAYGIKPEAKDKYWMVFDLGGGTFDVAIVSTYQGRLTILNNEGNNNLGGKDIDNLVVEKLFLPEIDERYTLFPFDSAEHQKLLRKLLFKAEDVKIELSNLDDSVVYIDDVGEDAKGDEINLEIEVSREDLETLLSDIIQETISLSEKALEGANIGKGDLNKIMLVGGSTQIPAIRNKLKESFEADLDYSLDPITVVAKGAAVYASLTLIGDKNEELDPLREHGAVVKLEYEPVTSNLLCTVSGVFQEESEIHEISVESIDGFWSSGWIPLQENITKLFEVDVRLQQNKTNKYILKARDKQGNSIVIEGGEFSIKHQVTYISVSKPLIPHTLSIEYVDNDGNAKLEPIVHKNTPLPAFGSHTFRASKELRKGQENDVIAIKIWEGEHYDEPEANMWVANLYVTSRGISRPLPKGSDIEISMEVDESRRINIEAYIPILNLRIDRNEFYKPTPIDTNDRFRQIEKDIDEFYQRLEYINGKIPYSDEVKRKEYNEIYDDVENFSIEYSKELELAKQDNESANKNIAKSKSIRVKILNLERSILVKKQQHQIEKDLLKTINRVNYNVDHFGSPEEKIEYEKYKGVLHEAVEFQDSRGVQHIKNKMEDLERDILMRRLDFWQDHFYYLCEKKEKFLDQNEAQKWLDLGNKADEEKDIKNLSAAVVKLYGLLEKDIDQVIEGSSLPPDLRK